MPCLAPSNSLHMEQITFIAFPLQNFTFHIPNLYHTTPLVPITAIDVLVSVPDTFYTVVRG